jgi:hypothetical protein
VSRLGSVVTKTTCTLLLSLSESRVNALASEDITIGQISGQCV